MMAFYRTQDLVGQISEQTDLLVTQNILIQYDPSGDVIRLIKVAEDSDQVLNWYYPSAVLTPKVPTISMLSGMHWVEPAFENVDLGEVDDFFEEMLNDDEDGSDRGNGTNDWVWRPSRNWEGLSDRAEEDAVTEADFY